MKKLGLLVSIVTMMFAAPAFAGEEPRPVAPPSLQNDDVVQLGPDHERLCREAESLQENRIRDLRAAIEYDKKVEADLLNGAKVREAGRGDQGRSREAVARVRGKEREEARAPSPRSRRGSRRRRARIATSRPSAARPPASSARAGAKPRAPSRATSAFLADLKTHCAS